MEGDTSPYETQAKPKTKHISSACVVCRTKKIKCDGASPKCSHCILYERECIYQPAADRRKIQRKDHMAALEARIILLESLLHANSIDIPTSEASLLTLQSRQIGKIDAPDHSNEVGREIQTRDQRSWSAEDGSLVDQLSGRMGSLQLADDGQLRFYGPTSNLTILQHGALSLGTTANLTPSKTWQDLLNEAGIGQSVDAELESHLLKLYFCWEDPSIHVVNQDVFGTEMSRSREEGYTSPTYSEALTNAMCSIGASLTARRCHGLPENLIEFFASRSKVLLESEMDSPKLSTVQSLVTLSAVEALVARDSRGWLYSGMAVRIATDLGLHIDAREYVTTGVMNQHELNYRSTIFWGTFVHDQMWSLYLGRPCALEAKHITLPYPQGGAELPSKYWSPYVDEHRDHVTPPLMDPVNDMTRHNVLLCAKMQGIREVIYNNRQTQRSDLKLVYDFTVRVSQELREWHAKLPSTLTVDLHDSQACYLPHILQLHMQYHCIMVLANRPFFTVESDAFDALGEHHTTAQEICVDAARSIASLLRIFDRLYTLQRINVQAVHLVFTASIVHAYNTCTSENATDQGLAASDLNICCQALRTIGQNFKHANRAHEVIIYLKVELLKRRRLKSKRPQPHTERPSEESDLKRFRFATGSNVSQAQPSLPFHSWRDVQDESSASFDPFFGHEVNLDPLFWNDLSTIDTNTNVGWAFEA